MGRKIVAFGELLWDVFQDGKKLGGAPLNLVYRSNTLGDQGFLLSRVGQDEPGAEALALLRKMNISDRYVQLDPDLPTGRALVRIGNEGRPDYLIDPEMAFDRIELIAEILDLVREADCLCFGSLSQRHKLSRSTLRQLFDAAPGTLKYLDLKLRKNC